MKSIHQCGLKITAATREYYRYTGASAELEQRGAGTSRPELAWVRRVFHREDQAETQKTPASTEPDSRDSL